jgi:ferredoxin/flavodoxin
MQYVRVWSAFYSATQTTKKVVTAVADRIAEKLAGEDGRPLMRAEFDFSRPGVRAGKASFSATDIVVFGTPTYAGRVPNLMLKFIQTIEGGGAVAVPIVLYGNRNFDDSLVELRDLLYKDGFYPVAAAAFVGEHSFSYILGAGRPDDADMEKAAAFADGAAEAVRAFTPEGFTPVEVEGVPDPYRGYYQPQDRNGNPIDIRKVKPLTNEKCTNCKLCADICPMGAIDREDVKEVPGICIKCGACTKRCPEGAKYYEDPGFLYHKTELEEVYTRRAEPALFLPK